MIGWRGRIGYVDPVTYYKGSEWQQVLPEGVAMFVAALDLGLLVPQEFERIFNLYQPAAEKLARHFKLDFILLGGTPVFTHIGYEKSKEMAKSIERNTGVPTRLQLMNHIDALNQLSAKKIVLATPYDKERTEQRRRLLQDLGFEVLSAKGTGAETPDGIASQTPYACYQIAKEVFLEAPEADAIYISCPGWEVVANIEPLETDLGKPVVASVPADIWAALTTMHVKGPVKGYGRLLEML